jgi:hypothetical protein
VLGLAGVLSPEAFFVFLFASVGLGVLLSMNALVLEELSFHLYPRPGQQFKLFLVAIFENFGYRQLTSVWRLMGLGRWLVRLRGRSRWGHVHRNATWQQQEGSTDDIGVPAPQVAGISSGTWPPSNHAEKVD